MLLRIATKRIEPDILVVELSGRITLGGESQGLETAVQELVARSERKIVLDLGGVDYVDSTGLGTITHCFSALKKAGGGLLVARAGGKVQHLFKITRLDTFLALFPTVEAACERFTTLHREGAERS